MSKLILKIILFLVSLSVFNSKIAKRYTINYDLPLEPQYKVIFTEFKDPLMKYMEYSKTIPGVQFLRVLTRLLTFNQSKQWFDTIKMFASASGYTIEDIILANMSYEIFCTSIVIRNIDKKVFLGRNLDFQGAPVLSKLSY